MGHFQAHAACWQNPVACGYRTEVPVSLMALGQGTFLGFKSHLYSLTHAPFSFKASNRSSSFSHALFFLPSLLLHPSLFRWKSSILKVLCDYIEPTQIIQDNLLILRSITLIVSAKSPLPYNLTHSQVPWMKHKYFWGVIIWPNTTFFDQDSSRSKSSLKDQSKEDLHDSCLPFPLSTHTHLPGTS